MEKMEYSCEVDCPEKVDQLNNDSPNLLVSIAKSEHDILGQERSFSMPSKVESYRENLIAHENVLSEEDNGKHVGIVNSVSCDELLLKSDVNVHEISSDEGKQNQVRNDNFNCGDDKSVNSKLIGQSFKSHICNEETLSDHDSISVSSEETLDHNFMVFHENDAAALTFDGSDKTCANGESDKTVRDNSEALRDDFKERSLHKDDRPVFTDAIHSFSEIKDRVMSYLNKPSVSSESGIKEDESEKMLAGDNTLTSKKSVMGENNCLINKEEDRALSFNSSLCGINAGPIKPDMISFNSPMEVIAKWDPTESSQNELISQHSLHDVAPETSRSNMFKFVQSSLSTELSNLEGNKVEEGMVEGSNSSTQHCNGNNYMEFSHPEFEETVCITDSVPSVTLNGSSMKTSASEVCLGLVTNGDPKILDCSGSSSGIILFDCKEHVSLSGRDERKHLSSQTFPSLTSKSSDGSFINESFQPCYKSGTILTNSSLSSWGKLSFQPFTTSSINSPIFSSKSTNEEKLDSGLLIRSPRFEERSVNLKTFSTLSQDNCKSRKTRSSEALFCTQVLPQSYDSVFSGSISGKTSSTFSNLNFTRPPILTESSWSVNNFNKKPVLEVEKTSSNLPAIDSPIICDSSVGGISACGPFKRFPENPFSKKLSESIGIFSSSQEMSGIGFPSVFRPIVSSVTLSPKREKLSGKISAVSQDSMNITFSESKETGLFSFNKNIERQPDKPKNSSIFSFSNCDKSNDAKKFAFNSSQSRLEKKHVFCLHQPNEHALSQFHGTPAPFLFQNKSEKSKGFNSHRCTRMVRKPCKQYDRGFSNLFKEANMLSTLQVDLPNTPFKPAFGSDVMLDKGGDAKNVMVRYQNIVFMKEHLNISPEELRAQYYHKAPVIGPFKFCASSEYSKSRSLKKSHNKEVQTDDNLSKKYELTEIWRALECPVCLDVVMPPVYQCEQGHHACLTCWNKVVTCPLCKKRKSVTRNYMAEALIDQIPLPCKYHIEGCKETVCRTNKVSHEETCSYRMYQCPVPLCNQAHSYQNMCTHFKKIHKSLLHHEGHSVGKGEKFCDVLYKDHLSTSLIHAFDIAKWGLFFLREYSKHSRALFIQVMPASPEPAAYFYHLEVSDHHDCRKECYKGRVFSMGKPIQEIVDEEEYLSLSELILKTVKKSAPLKIVVTIWQLKPAFTLSTD